MKHITKKQALLGVFSFFMVGTLSFLMTSNMKKSDATMAGFSAGNIISDYVMGNYNSMNESQIQAFLKSKNSCNDTGTYKAQQYPNYSYHIVNGHFVCMADENFNGESAAHIIWQAAQDYRINPQVLIVLLQKEQGLVTDTWPNSVQYRSATGYGCPDTAACDSQYYGLKNQIRNAAELYRWILDHGSKYYPVGWNNVRFSPNAACGSSRVNIENNATAALYQYTPYQPNAAAINAGYGTGDACSAYGNRNFYNYFTDWFGDTRYDVKGFKASVPDGEYVVVLSKDQTKALDVDDGSTIRGTNVQIWSKNSEDSQAWYISKRDDGFYSIINPQSGKALDLNGSNSTNGSNIQIWDKNDGCGQKWRLIETPDNSITFVSACSTSAVLDLEGGKTNNGSNIEIWVANNSDAQKWKLIPRKTITPGIYTFSSALNQNKAIDVNGGSTLRGANVQIWDRHDGNSQQWSVRYDSNTGFYSIINPQSGKALDLNGSNPANGSNIQIWDKNDGCGQKWRILKRNDESISLLSACSHSKSLDLNGGKTTNGSNIQIWQSHNENSQKWFLRRSEQVIQDGIYVIFSAQNNNMALDVNGGSVSKGANVQIWDRHDGNSQQWLIKYNPNDDYYSIINPHSGKALDLNGSNPANGSNIQIWDQNNGCGQKWHIFENANNYLLVPTCFTGQVLDINSGAATIGSNVQIWSRHNGLNQLWHFEKI